MAQHAGTTLSQLSSRMQLSFSFSNSGYQAVMIGLMKLRNYCSIPLGKSKVSGFLDTSPFSILSMLSKLVFHVVKN